MNNKLKNWPLSRQILVIFMLLTIILGISVGILYPLALQKSLIDNTFTLLEEEFTALSGHISFDEQNNLLPVPAAAPHFLQLLLSRYQYTFDMFVFRTDGKLLGVHNVEPIPVADASDLFRLAASYKQADLQHGRLERAGETYLFVSKKMEYYGFPYYLVLFSKERELSQINTVVTRPFFIIFVTLLFISWFLAVWFSRYLSKPLQRLDEVCQRIARRQFDIPLSLDRQDEIGQLARSFDSMKHQLKEYDDSQRHFVQNISHELKTPIMAIQGYAQGLLEGVFQGPQADKGLQIIIDESKRLEKVVEQLLYITKIESVSQMLHMSPLNLRELFDYLHQRLTVLNPQVEWVINLPNTLPTNGDGEQLNTAFQNILENQLRYAKSKITIEASQSENELEIAIANDGPPVEEALLPNLFQRFRKGKGGKHGLGLAIARAVIEAHGGTIQAQNYPEGVRFLVTLPTADTN